MQMFKIRLSSVNFKGFDPEIYTGGGGANNASRGEYPQARTFTLGTNIVF